MNNLKAYFVPHPPLIVPEIGKGEEQTIKKTIAAYQHVAKEIAVFKPDTILFLSPHALTYDDYFHIERGIVNKGDFGAFNAPYLTFENKSDLSFIQQIEDLAKVRSFHSGTLGRQNNKLDHGVMVPMYFINQEYKNYEIVRLSFSGLSFLTHYNYGKLIQEVEINNPNKKYVFVASGDLSHMLKSDGPYGYAEEGPLFDRRICEIISSGNFLDLFTLDPVLIEGAGECGFRSLMVLAGLLDKRAVQSKLLSYEGPFGVGYAVASFDIKDVDENRNYGVKHEKEEAKRITCLRNDEDPYVALARQSLEHYVQKGIRLSLDKVNYKLLEERAGVFVSIKKQGMLRGCIGTIRPTTPSVTEEIVQNAVSSGTEDPRFDPVTKSELAELIYSVDVLKTPEKISSPNQLDVKKYGVIVRYRGRSGLLLPNLDGVNTIDEQIAIALQKAGIDKNDPYSLERFEVIRHH